MQVYFTVNVGKYFGTSADVHLIEDVIHVIQMFIEG